jgi:hypothetical protein
MWPLLRPLPVVRLAIRPVARPFSQQQQQQRRNVLMAGGLCFFGGTMMAVPLIIRTMQTQPMINQDKALTGSQVQRGPFINSGSKDAGRDTDWNLQTRTWEGKRNKVGDDGN